MREERALSRALSPLAHEVVRLDGGVDVLAVDAHGDAHDHVLGALGDLAVDLEKVRLLEGLEAEVVELKVAVVDDGGIEPEEKKGGCC